MKRVIGIGIVSLAILSLMACQGTTDSGGGTTAQPLVKLLSIKGGTFARDNDGTGPGTETTNITVSDFYLGETEVTQAQWSAVMGSAMPDATKEFNDGKGENHPMYYVNWYDTVEFCNALSAKEGLVAYYTIDKTNKDPNNNVSDDKYKWTVTVNAGSNGYRLPTEAEWEYAAGHGGFESDGTTPKKRTVYAGTDTEGTEKGQLGDYAWYEKNNGSSYVTKAVKTKLPNALGLYDMSGNMWEWCWDWWGSYDANAKTNPIGATSGQTRVIRGGNRDSYSDELRVVYRNTYTPHTRETAVGLRVARSY